MSEARLRVRGVRKSFGERTVLSEVDLDLPPGRILGLLGPNGAGKSTLISIANGSLAPDSGSVFVDGIDLASHRESASALIGSAPQRLGIYPSLTLRENVEAFARLHGVRGRAVRSRSTQVIEGLGLTKSTGVRAERLSGGQQRRLHLAMALTHSPRLLFLDEPTVGADVESRQQILDLVRRIADDGASVLYTTHYLTELEQLPSRLALLHDGVLRDLGDVSDVVKSQDSDAVRVRLQTSVRPPAGWAREADWLVRRSAGTSAGELLAELIADLGEGAGAIADVQFPRPTLESACVRLLRGGETRAIDPEEVPGVAA
ncbi:MAG: ATP-binding cassette protein [Microbacterium sp.]|jgi:ABC-2 type transport system ATP-binding protein|uniref:ABC transporter ATP-binding protein n=1 Tax=Microbacterium sp. TaxID=51671 RepID=UPI00262BAAD3|nr:ABC transporter ATP-binding protein [Microbacterium sp.]MDF2558622.1 ATP-binding cassette protein [Microbacterium sp.]